MMNTDREGSFFYIVVYFSIKLIMQFIKGQELALQHNIELGSQLKDNLPALIFGVVPSTEGLLVRTSPSKIRALSFFFRNSTVLQLRTLVDISVVDKLLPTGRFSVNYLFLSVVTNQRLTLQVFASETTTLPSIAIPYANGQRLFAAAG